MSRLVRFLPPPPRATTNSYDLAWVAMTSRPAQFSLRNLTSVALALVVAVALLFALPAAPDAQAQMPTPITSTPSGAITLEVGAQQALTLVLGAKPTSDVTVLLVATNPAVVGLSVGGGEPAGRVALSFTAADWQTGQTVTLTGLSPGPATIARQVSGGGTPSYYVRRVEVNAPVARQVPPQDDCLSDTTTTCSISAPSGDIGEIAVTGEIEVEGDVDWFSVSFASGGKYRINIQGSRDDSANTLWTRQVIAIYDSSGALVPGTAHWNDYGWVTEIAFQATDAATHYIAVSHGKRRMDRFYPASQPATGTYTLRVSLWPEDDCIEAPSTSCLATVGTPFAGEIQGTHGDYDWIGVDLTSGSAYQIDVEGQSTSNGTLLDPQLSERYRYVDDVGRSTSLQFTRDRHHDGGTGTNERVAFKASRTGRHYFVVSSQSRQRNGTYTLTVSELTSTVDDYSDDQSGSSIGAITLTDGSGTATGNIELIGDQDWFQVQLTGGQHYLISQGGVSTRLGHTGYTLGNTRMEGIYNSLGEQLLRAAAYRAYDSWNTFTPPKTATYYILASASTSGRPPTGTYIVAVRQLPADDHPADTSTTSTVSVGGSASGVIGTLQDVDWHRAQLTSGAEYVFDIAAPSGDNPNSCDRDRYIGGSSGSYNCLLGWNSTNNVFFGGMHDSSGNDVSDGVAFGDSPYRLTFTPTTSGTYYVSTKSEFGWYEVLGDYTVSLQTSADATMDDFPADAGTTAVLTTEQPLTGWIDYIQDRDYVRVSLQPGSRYRFDVQAYRNYKFEEIPGTDGVYRAVAQPDSGRHKVRQGIYLYTLDGRKVYGVLKSMDYRCYEVETAADLFLEVVGHRFDTGRYDVSMFEYVGESCDD